MEPVRLSGATPIFSHGEDVTLTLINVQTVPHSHPDLSPGGEHSTRQTQGRKPYHWLLLGAEPKLLKPMHWASARIAVASVSRGRGKLTRSVFSEETPSGKGRLGVALGEEETSAGLCSGS